MPRGGRRPGAGRPKGSKSTKPTLRERALAEAQASGVTPLQYMLDVMRDHKVKIARRDDMAKAAAPYVHPRLQAIEGNPDKPVIHEHRLDDLQLARAVAYILHRATRPQERPALEAPRGKKVPA